MEQALHPKAKTYGEGSLRYNWEVTKGKFLKNIYPGTSSIFERQDKWDILILLDGCRYDTFMKLNFLPGKLSLSVSKASCTLEWARENITSRYADIVYVSANPFLSRSMLEKNNMTDPFFLLEEVWDYGWDSELNTVPPDRVSKAALRLHKEYPEKKMVIHYIQPHHPFIGKTRLEESGWKVVRDSIKYGRYDENLETVYQMLEKGKLTREEVLKAYGDNLILVLEEVSALSKHLRGRIVLSSDHGDCFGEFGIYAHPEGVYIPALIQVPWFVLDRENVQRIPLEPVETELVKQPSRILSDNEVVKQRLRDLGYIE